MDILRLSWCLRSRMCSSQILETLAGLELIAVIIIDSLENARLLARLQGYFRFANKVLDAACVLFLGQKNFTRCASELYIALLTSISRETLTSPAGTQ